MGRVSLKALIRAVFYAVVVIALSGCIMEPINLANFVEDEEVIEIIDRSAGKVFPAKLPDGQDNPNLIGGNGKITVLYDSEYYIIEYYGENPAQGQKPIDIMFVTANGTCTEPAPLGLTGIGRLTGEEKVITGLTNYHTYNVRPAQVLTGMVTYYDLAGLVGGSTAKQIALIIEGSISIKPPESSGYIFFTPPSPSSTNGYEIGNCYIVKVPVSPAGPTASVSLIPIQGSNNIFMEAPADTEADFVFFEEDRKLFYVLKVKITDEKPPDPPEPGLHITITPYTHPDQSITFNPSSAPYTRAQAINGLIDINVTYTNFTSAEWYYNGTTPDRKVCSGLSLTSNLINTYNTTGTPPEQIDFTRSGEHIFIFVGTRVSGGNAVQYSGTFTVVILQ